MEQPATPADSGFEDVACDNCGARGGTHLFTGSDLIHGLPGKFPVVQCDVCGWIRQNPRPSERHIGSYYLDDYVSYMGAIEDERWPWRRWDRRYGVVKRCWAIERFVARGTLLEIGCGTGIFLNEMKRRGWTVAGIEPQGHASGYARSRFGLDVFQGRMEDYAAAPASFDVVALWNVLEHLPYPAQSIARIRRLLRPGGLLVFSVPNCESLDRRLFGRSWVGWELPRHLYLFPHDSLVRFLAAQGFQLLTTTCPAGSFHASILSLQMWLRSRLGRGHWPLADAIAGVARTLPFRLLSAPPLWVSDTLRLSSIVSYFARKQN